MAFLLSPGSARGGEKGLPPPLARDFYVRDFYTNLRPDSGFLHLGLFRLGKDHGAQAGLEASQQLEQSK
jgi:hypothetical protein